MTDHTPSSGMSSGSQQSQYGASQNVVTAMFDSHESANRAVEDLISAGFPRSSVNLMRDDSSSQGSSYDSSTTGASSTSSSQDKGFWASMADLFSSDDQATYSEGLRRGGYLVSAQVSDSEQENRASDILSNAGAIDIDERASSWRDSGWQGYGGQSSSRGLGSTGDHDSSMQSGMVSDQDATRMDGLSSDNQQSANRAEQVIPIAEEQVHVGKRESGGRRVRVHTRQSERPVEQDVTLREEHVDVSRRPASGDSLAGQDPFQERTVEIQAMKEEPVVAKEAQVIEEVVVGKRVEEHTETVRDTVRKTEVDVEEDTSGPNHVSRPSTGKRDNVAE